MVTESSIKILLFIERRDEVIKSLFSNLKTVSSNRIIYTPSLFARSSLLYLQETGTLSAEAVHKSSRRNLLSYLFFIVLSGKGELMYEGINYKLNSNDCVFIDCEKPYSHITSENLWKLKWCHFNGPEMKSIYDKYKQRGGKVVFSCVPNNYIIILDNIYKTAVSSSYVRDMKINALISDLLVNLMEDAWNPENVALTDKQKEIQKIKVFLDSNYNTRITLDSLSSWFLIDKFYLCEQFKEHYGITINDYLTNVRITEAKKLLRFSNKTMEEIAEAIGINGAAYFSRLFKRVEGITPSSFRKMW